MASNPAAADLTIASIPFPAPAGSWSSAVARRRRNVYSVLHLVRAMFYGAPAIPVLEDGHPVAAEERQLAVAQGRVVAVVAGTINSYLRTCSLIPMVVCPSLLRGGGVPVTCAYCNRVFCIGVYEVPWLNPPRGHAFPELPAAGLVSPPAVEPLYVNYEGGGPGPSPSSSRATAPVAVLQVCSSPRHFMVRMGRLRLPNNAASLVWTIPSSLGVVPAVVGGVADGGRLQRRRATAAARPLEASTSSAAGANNRNFVMPGDESLVQLTLRQNQHDPLKLTLGWQ